MCAHALLIGDALQRIKAVDIVEDIIATNSVPGECAKVDYLQSYLLLSARR